MNSKLETIKSYDTNASFLAEYFRGLLDIERRREFREFISVLPGKNILDLGCGGGDHSAYFVSQRLDVVAADISGGMARIAKSRGIRTVIMDMENLGFQDDAFDGIWAVTSLLHVPKSELPGVVRNLSYLLKQNGVIYSCVKEGEGERMIVDKLNPSTRRFFAFWQGEEFLNLFEPYFNLINFRKNTVGSTNFLHYLGMRR